ncbi:hypothetical protein JKP88DRAFT_265145 [Tribonema minus]|uniref:BHLH domain-containing protein n=1 Tax=Tribonema minus TaxID=303371 RepID=A0A835YKM8_9STRA|nr:hypothetical protein JKP88DRAFT_265145 [Tribonema minus]
MTPHESSTMMDSELLFGIEHVLSDMDELDYALLEQSMAEATGQDAPGDRRISGRKRTFSSVGEAVCENAAAEAAARPCSPVQAGDAPDMGRVERKKSRERMRRVEVNDRFEELQKLLTAIEPALAPPGKAAAKPAAAVNRVELLTRAIRVMRRLWQDRQSGCATPPSTVTLTPAVPPPALCAAAPAAAAVAPVAPAPPLLAPALGAAAGGMAGGGGGAAAAAVHAAAAGAAAGAADAAAAAHGGGAAAEAVPAAAGGGQQAPAGAPAPRGAAAAVCGGSAQRGGLLGGPHARRLRLSHAANGRNGVLPLSLFGRCCGGGQEAAACASGAPCEDARGVAAPLLCCGGAALRQQ